MSEMKRSDEDMKSENAKSKAIDIEPRNNDNKGDDPIERRLAFAQVKYFTRFN